MNKEDMLLDEHEPLEWTVESIHSGERMDKYVTDTMNLSTATPVSRSQVQHWIKNGNIWVNGLAVKANYRINTDDEIVLNIPDSAEVDITPEDIKLEVYYEDSDIIVINKQRGVVVHPAPGHSKSTLVHGLLFHCKDLSGINGELRPGIVHRIDKDTSGLLVAAKNDFSHQQLAKQFKVHSVIRKYVAIVHGKVPHSSGTVDAPIGRDEKDRKLFAVTDKNSKHAVTHFAVIERFKDYTMLELKLETGRTHQIRVHMKFIGHPIVGDPAYGRSKGLVMEGQALHAQVLGFIHPRDGKPLEFTAPLPDDMRHLLTILRSQ